METDAALLWGFVVLILLVVATVTGLLIHSGLLTSVEVKTCKPDIGEIKIAYKFARGPYKDSGALYTQVHSLLPEYRTVGVYYDDPKTKQPHKLRYIVGIIISENGSTTPQEHISMLEKNGYHFATFPAIDHAVQARFPFNSTVSIIVAIMKVYPAIREYIEARSLCARPFLEVYDSEKAEILFVGPLARQDDFYVPEVLQEEEDEHREDEFDDDHTENSSRSWDESASIIRGHEVNDSECSESVGDDSSSFARPLPPPPLNAPASVPSDVPSPPQMNVSAQPDQDTNDSECSESLEDDSVPSQIPSSLPPLLPSHSDAPSESFMLPQQNTLTPADTLPDATGAGAGAAAPSAPLDPLLAVGVGENNETASAGEIESDANTASSFEEIDEKEAASIPDIATFSESRGSSLRKDDDEGER